MGDTAKKVAKTAVDVAKKSTPYTAAVGVVADVIGLIINYDASKRAEKQYQREFDEEKRKSRFAEAVTMEDLGLQKQTFGLEKKRFGEEKKKTNFLVSQEAIKRAENLLSNNMALRDSVLKTWAHTT